MTSPTNIPTPQEITKDAALIDMLIVLAKRKRFILGMTFVVAAATIGVTLMMTKTYVASTKILPPQQAQSGAAALLAQLGGVAGAAAGAAGIKNPNDLYVGMLKSRTIGDAVIKKFDLKNVYEKDTMEMTRKQLTTRTTITAGRDGLIEIQLEDTSPERSAQMANAYTEELLKLTKTLAITEASQRRLFFERQLETTKDKLSTAEAALKQAFNKSGVVSVDAESRTLVEIAARLRAQITSKEIALASMRNFMTADNQEYKRVQAELVSLRNEYNRLENGRSTAAGEDASGKIDGLESIKVLREVKYHQMLYELLSKQFEVARLDEAKDSSIIQVLDKAQVPELKAKPKRAAIVIMMTILGFIVAVLWVLFADARERAMRQPEYAEKARQLRQSLRFK